ncbi:MAG: hypothetical protein JWQ98_2136 [Chlorobi bacterium]|nr:hypothetical protein [Chlorobiota bacterium]
MKPVDALSQLCAMASPALGAPDLPGISMGLHSLHLRSLSELLLIRNGFYALSQALHVYPLAGGAANDCLLSWNSTELWRAEYGELTDDLFFFAADIFGGQFCLTRSGIGVFNPETAEVEVIASSLEEWARAILDPSRGNILTGYTLSVEWQRKHGQLSAGNRLVPKIPFIFGGKYEVDNLFQLDAVKAMHFYGFLARKTHGLPDGSKIILRVT